MLKKTHFPNDLLFMGYSFYKEYSTKPKSYFELFEFCKLKEVEGLLEEYNKRLGEMK